MRVLIQRVTRGSVSVDGAVTGSITDGLVLFTGICPSDTIAEIEKMARKVANLRIFSDEQGRFSHSLLETGGGALVVSQFTLYADTRKGRRPSFLEAAPPEMAEPLIERFARRLESEGVVQVARGVFGASMKVDLCNHGPVTIWLDSESWSR